MRTALTVSLLLLCTPVALGAEPALHHVSWAALREAGRLAQGEIVAADDGGPAEALKLANATDQPETYRLAVFDDPGIQASRYAVRGQVRHVGVEEKSYLEMWNDLPGGDTYFTRTLADRGLMRSIRGDCGWRPFALPFSLGDGGPRPTRLEVRLVLSGKGTVWVGPLELVELGEGDDLFAAGGAWWSDRQAGLIGGISGTLIGCLGALIGTLSSLGRGRRLVMLVTWSMVVGGVAALAVGVVALVGGQPYAVYYPLLLVGGISAAVCGGMLPTIRRRYVAVEQERMRAKDLGAGASSHAYPSP